MLKRLKISENGRYLCQETGEPFFWLGDTAWELFHRLDRAQAEYYLKDRAKKGFNVIQAVALAEQDGLRVPNAYGRVPLLKDEQGRFDPCRPDTKGDSYWSHVDTVMDLAESLGLYVALLPTWGDKYNVKSFGVGPEIFTPENAFQYGFWLGKRYGDRANLIWLLGGDRPLETETHFSVVRMMKKGLRDGEAFPHLIGFHPPGDSSSSAFLPDELDFHMIQSGHMMDCYLNYHMVEADYARKPVRPVIDGEPRYEDHPKNFRPEDGFFHDADVRSAAYWSVFSGAFGHTYGHSSVWCMEESASEYRPFVWRQALGRPGAGQMKHLKRLMLSRPFFERIPCQKLVPESRADEGHLCATRGERYAMVYTPNGNPFRVELGHIAGEKLVASWYDPRTGRMVPAGECENRGSAVFSPPKAGLDWVLVLDDSAAEFAGRVLSKES